MWHQEMQLKRNSFDGWKIWNFTIGGKFSNENPKWSFRQMPQQKAGGILQRNFHRGKWSKEEKIFHTNVLELLALKLLIITFTRNLPRNLNLEFQVMQPNVSPCPGDQFLLQVTNQLEQMGLMVLPTANWSSLCTFKWNIEPFVNTVWKRPTISTYKFTPLCYFSLPRLCRWKACWETHFPCFTDRCLQSKSTTALLYIFLGC